MKKISKAAGEAVDIGKNDCPIELEPESRGRRTMLTRVAHGIVGFAATTGGVKMVHAENQGNPKTGNTSDTCHPSNPLLVSFVAGETGTWKIDSMQTLSGEGLSLAPMLTVVEAANLSNNQNALWVLQAVPTHVRYATRSEVDQLKSKQEGLNRPASTRAALIPMRKSAAWWALSQDERRAIFEEGSHHIAIGMEYLPAIARRLLHCRDLGQPFDFLAWLEYAPEDSEAFETLMRRLRATPEWSFVDCEIDIRLSKI